jgi:diguanylate cyclase (GGDEF)-like protein
LPSTDDIGSKVIAERIRANIEALAIQHDFSDCKNVVTVSIGISILAEDALNDIDLLKQADKALYRAKKAGRNRFVSFL